jgi:hypothetical protein
MSWGTFPLYLSVLKAVAILYQLLNLSNAICDYFNISGSRSYSLNGLDWNRSLRYEQDGIDFLYYNFNSPLVAPVSSLDFDQRLWL